MGYNYLIINAYINRQADSLGIPPALPYPEINQYTTNMKKNKNTYDAPTITIVEVKACARLCIVSNPSRSVMIGSDSGDSYGVQNYEAGETYDW